MTQVGHLDMTVKELQLRAMAAKRHQEGEVLFSLPGGATRSEEAPSYHLIPVDGTKRVAQRWALGAKKHGAHNWKRSLDTKEHAAAFCIEAYNHMQEHLSKLISRADLSDDHLGAVGWGVGAIAEAERIYGRDFWTEAQS